MALSLHDEKAPVSPRLLGQPQAQLLQSNANPANADLQLTVLRNHASASGSDPTTTRSKPGGPSRRAWIVSDMISKTESSQWKGSTGRGAPMAADGGGAGYRAGLDGPEALRCARAALRPHRESRNGSGIPKTRRPQQGRGFQGMEPSGFEPLTPCMPCRCSTS